jgi:hypothetical protein
MLSHTFIFVKIELRNIGVNGEESYKNLRIIVGKSLHMYGFLKLAGILRRLGALGGRRGMLIEYTIYLQYIGSPPQIIIVQLITRFRLIVFF